MDLSDYLVPADVKPPAVFKLEVDPALAKDLELSDESLDFAYENFIPAEDVISDIELLRHKAVQVKSTGLVDNAMAVSVESLNNTDIPFKANHYSIVSTESKAKEFIDGVKRIANSKAMKLTFSTVKQGSKLMAKLVEYALRDRRTAVEMARRFKNITESYQKFLKLSEDLSSSDLKAAKELFIKKVIATNWIFKGNDAVMISKPLLSVFESGKVPDSLLKNIKSVDGFVKMRDGGLKELLLVLPGKQSKEQLKSTLEEHQSKLKDLVTKTETLVKAIESEMEATNPYDKRTLAGGLDKFVGNLTKVDGFLRGIDFEAVKDFKALDKDAEKFFADKELYQHDELTDLVADINKSVQKFITLIQRTAKVKRDIVTDSNSLTKTIESAVDDFGDAVKSTLDDVEKRGE